MRSSLLLASVLALGAAAKPVDKRYIVTEVDLEVVTKVVYVTAGPEPTAQAEPHYTRHGRKSKSKVVAAPSTSVVYVAPPATPVSTAPAYSEIVATEAPVSSAAPASSKAVTSAAPVASAAPVTGTHESGEGQSDLSSGAEYQAALVYHHNAVRANHNAAPLEWDEDTANNAYWSASKCVFKHQFADGVQNGQNIFTTSGSSFNVTAAVVESWYKGELPPMLPYFGQKDVPSNVFESVGHLTALVWKSTTKFGCASVDCAGKMTMQDGTSTDMDKFTVCNYADSVPNMLGEFDINVLPPISSNPTLSWSD